jgi:autotransporter-associated beta strand protein
MRTRKIARNALIVTAAASAGALLATHANAQTNLLIDPGFAAGVDGAPAAATNDDASMGGLSGNQVPWNGFENYFYPYSAYYTVSNVTPRTAGDQIGKTFGGNSSPFAGGIYQVVSGESAGVYSGDTYVAAGWLDDDASDPLVDGDSDSIQLNYFAAPESSSTTGDNGTPAALEYTSVSPYMTSSSNPPAPSTWVQFSTPTGPTAVTGGFAVYGTQALEWEAVFGDAGNNGGALFVDDASLIDVTPVWNGSGSDNNWMTANNWSNPSGAGGASTPGAPASPSGIIFDGTAQTTANNNFASGTTFTGIRFGAQVGESAGSTGAFTLTGNSIDLAGDIINNSTTTQTINLGLVLSNAVTNNVNINGNGAGTGNIVINGAISGGNSITEQGPGTVTLNGANSYSAGTNVADGELVIGTNGALPANSAVSITGGTLQLGQSTGGETISSLSISANGVLDITNNHLIISYGGSDPMSAIYSALQSGYSNGTWNGAGIISSSAQVPTNSLRYGIGFADGADGVVANLPSGQIELKYTLLGDANLDGTVNGSDFSILAANFGLGRTNWDQGNFLYGPSVNGSDFSALAANFGQGDSGADGSVTPADIAALDAFAAANGQSLPTIAAVPEPASIGLLAAGAVYFTRRRRRR